MSDDDKRATPDLSRRARAWILAGLAIALGASFPYLSRMMNANERPRVLQAIAFVDTGELAIDGPGARGVPAGIDVARSPVDGRLYPNKPPGATAAGVLGYALVRANASVRGRDPTLREATWAMRMVGGLIPMLVLCGFLLRRGRASASAVIFVALATPLVAYARLLFGHALAGALLTIGIVLVVEAMRGDPSSRRAFFGGLIAGSAVVVEYGAAFGGLPIAVWVAMRLRDPQTRPAGLAAIAGAAIPIAFLLSYHDAVFGSPWSTPYHHVVDAKFEAIHARGLLGLGLPTRTSLFEHLLSPWGGLLYWAPLCVGVLAAALASWRSLSPLARIATASFAVLLLFNLGLQQTGGWRVGPRYLVVGMPLCILPLSELLGSATRSRIVAIVGVAVLLWSTFVNFLAGNLVPHLIPVGNPLTDQLLALWTAGYAPYSALAGIFGPPLALTVVGLVTLMLLAWALLSLRWDSSLPIATAGGAALALLAMVVALSIEPAPDAENNLQALRGAWEPRPDVTVAHTMLSPVDARPSGD